MNGWKYYNHDVSPAGNPLKSSELLPIENRTIWIINHYALTPAQGGLSRHYFFSRELQRRGYRVRIFTSSAIHNTDINMIENSEKCFFKDVEYNGVKYTYLKSSGYRGNGLSRIKNMLEFAFSIKRIWKRYAHEKPDLIYTSSPDIFTAWKAEKFAKKHGLPCVVEIRDLWPLSIVEYKGLSNHNPAICALYHLEKRIYKRADALVFTMKGGKDYIVDKGWESQVDSRKIFNVNNGIVIEEQNVQRLENIIDDADLINDDFRVVYAGSIRTVNSVDLIVRAAELLKDHSRIKFLIYGIGDKLSELENYCLENNLTNVKFKGKVDKKFIPYICSQAGVNVISVKQTGVSKYGVSWNKLFDYLNAGRPILSTVLVNYDLIEEHHCGVSLSEQTPQAIANGIKELYRLSPDEYAQMCENAKNAAKDFDYSKLTDKLEDVIEYAINNHGGK